MAHREGNKENKEHVVARESTTSFIKRKWTQDLGGISSRKPSRRARTNNNNYAVGTAVSKEFVDKVSGEHRHLSGEVTRYDADGQSYRVKYDDGDEEQLNHEALSKIVLIHRS